MHPRDRDTSQSRSTNTRSSPQPPVTTSHNEEQLDDLVRSILSHTLSRFNGDAKDTGRNASQTQDGAQTKELAQAVLGHVAQFAVRRYLKYRKKKARQAREQSKRFSSGTEKTMPFLFGSGGRPLGSGERERMQRRREESRSIPYRASYDSYTVSYRPPYTGSEEIHLTDPLPPAPEPVVPSAPYCPAPEPKLRRRRRHHNLSGRDKDTGRSDAAPETPFVPPLARSYTWDTAPSPYVHRPSHPLHDGYSPPVSPYIPAETPREQQRRRVSERDSERGRREREYEAERRLRKGERPERDWSERDKDRRGDTDGTRERDRRTHERDRRAREAELALNIDDLLVAIRHTDDMVYRNMYRPLVDSYDEHRDHNKKRCICRDVIMQSADLQRSLARSRSSAHAVRALLNVPLVEERRRRRSNVQFVSEQTM